MWKGSEEEKIEVNTALSDTSCGYPCRDGESYLIYASEGMQVNLCSNIKPLSSAGTELEALGPGEPPSEEQEGKTSGNSLPKSDGVLPPLSAWPAPCWPD